ncbi:MAG TPA: TatD family hydrolase [Candidatus Paceibacterota bacterium]|mgnify:CR=1 FL=1|jgi:TatD DNase family protein|nr:hydrolase TatD [Parcubacteria group bacterium]MDP6119590.1 TatD family hydrolase [Candidatus Paceibacterota bacterium]HJN62835.1 TatD family hydrolase [Candidatus Paceibacterota bacterium]|tara:strand:- start:4559 stop:5353 length:795 start_codon:yes stop_codon:yes gene_type:complete
MIKYIDIHSHLNLKEFNDDLPGVISRMNKQEVGTIVIGVDKKTSELAVKLSNENENIWACVGIHPTDSVDDFDEGFFEELIKNPKVVCIGECGLDYFRLKNEEEKEKQKELFERQIDFAAKHDLPLMLHVRPSKGTQDAHLDVFKILESKKKEYKDKLRGNSHFFASTKEIAEEYIKFGFTISFTGLITYIQDFNEIIESIPLEMIHIETDAPFVAPVPHRGKRNEPIYVIEVAKRIAEIKKISETELIPKLLENSSKFFNLKF